MMRPSAVVINVGRRPVIDEAALLRALSATPLWPPWPRAGVDRRGSALLLSLANCATAVL
jgi:hypothetical protein